MNVADTPIITYHQMTSDSLYKDSLSLTVSVHQFERQMRYLREHGYNSLSARELIQSLGNNQQPRCKRVWLTFDDGYESFFRLAYPILYRYGFTATVFLTTDFIGKDSDYLSWEQVLSLNNDGISFGSHTCTHPHLLELSEEQVRHELVSSKECLEDRLGEKVQLLAYPHGHSNLEIQHLAEDAGYEAACGIRGGRSSRFNLWRTQCHTEDTLLSFLFQLTRWPYYAKHFREETALGQFIRTVKHKISR